MKEKNISSQEQRGLVIILILILDTLILLLLVIIAVQTTWHPPNSDALVKAPAVHHAAIAHPAPGSLQTFDRAFVASDGAHLCELAAALPAPQADGLVGGAGAHQVSGDA